MLCISPVDSSGTQPQRLVLKQALGDLSRRTAKRPVVRIWCKALSAVWITAVWTTKKARALGLGLSAGAGDENRTRAPSLGITGHQRRITLMNCNDVLTGSPGSQFEAPV
jgi:hypothetical protein